MGVNTLGYLGLSEADAFRRRIGSTFIVDYGIVKDIPSDGIVTVEMSGAQDKQSIIIVNCVLASFASGSFTLNIKPNIDDKVLVLFPKNFTGNMFDEKENEAVISEATTGYCLLGGIALLLNQFQSFHKNYLDLSDGCIDLKLAYKKDDDKNLLSLVTNADGEMEFSTNENIVLKTNKEGETEFNTNDNFSLKIDKEGAVAVTANNTTFNISKDDKVSLKCGKSFSLKSNNTTVSISDEDVITVGNGKATVTVKKDGNIEINTSGKYTFKNSTVSLKDVIDGLAKELENLTTTGSPATQATSPASKTTISSWRQFKLNNLFG